MSSIISSIGIISSIVGIRSGAPWRLPDAKNADDDTDTTNDTTNEY